MRIPFDSHDVFKAKSKLLGRIIGIVKPTEALEFLAKLAGYANYHEVRKSCLTQGQPPSQQEVANLLLKLHPGFSVPRAVAAAEKLGLHTQTLLPEFAIPEQMTMWHYVTKTGQITAYASDIQRDLLEVFKAHPWLAGAVDWNQQRLETPS